MGARRGPRPPLADWEASESCRAPAIARRSGFLSAALAVPGLVGGHLALRGGAPLRAQPRPAAAPRGLRQLATAAGEQAWHRRARRRRQLDRAVIAVAAARGRLALHHGGGGDNGGMAQRGGRGGGDAPLAKRLMAFLQRECGGDASGGEQRGRGSAGRGARGNSRNSDGRGMRGGGRTDQHREGDWKCRHCGFQPNFSFRSRCWKCGGARGDSQHPGGSAPGGRAAGPVGAGGSRPLLGGGTSRGGSVAREDRPPSYRVPGASLAAKAAVARAASPSAPTAAQHGARRKGPGAPGRGGEASQEEKQLSDDDGDDGFRRVQRRRGRNGGGAKGDQGQADAQRAGDVDMDMDLDDSVEPADGGDGDLDEADDDVPEEAPGPTELRQLWQQEVGVVKRLARQGLSADHPAMVAAIAARDGAEAKWREAKAPAPLATRLGWAQKKLDRAITIQAGTRQEMQDLERQFNENMADLQARMAEDSARVRTRRQQLETIQAEAGGGAPTQRIPGADGEAVRKACDTLRQEVAPALAALAEQLGTGTDAWATVNGLLARLSASQQVMDKAAEAAQFFDLADGDESYWSESHDLQPGGGGGGNREDGGVGADSQATRQEWQPRHQQDQWGQRQSEHPGTGHSGGGDDAQSGGYWQPSDWAAAPRWRERGHGQWTRASWADAWENEQYGDDEDMDAQTEPQCKHRRQGGANYGDGGEQQGGGGGSLLPAAQAGQAPLQGQPCDAARQHSAMLASIVEAAISAGVQPLTVTGEELHILDTQQLATWAAENLPPN